MSFEQKIVLVTGAGRGTGRAMAEAFAAQGALVAANDITPVNLDETMERITRSGGIARDYVVDVARKMSLQAMINQVLDEWQRIDILVNSAGVAPAVPLLDMDAWDWQRTMDVNLNGPFFTTQTVGRVMREQGGGVILNMAYSQGNAHNIKDQAAFVTSKMGLAGLTRQAARELAAYNIRVNAVFSGVIEAEMAANSQQVQVAAAKWLEGIPKNHLGQPKDVVGIALFLCSQAASHITGQVVNLPGEN